MEPIADVVIAVCAVLGILGGIFAWIGGIVKAEHARDAEIERRLSDVERKQKVIWRGMLMRGQQEVIRMGLAEMQPHERDGLDELGELSE